ncbi:PepSY-associated TM helix domain-containing protein [Maribacter sp.]|uniref:PepSY-associated TM helix domain-containing protein n=1 Tax=Maribacter sp. TaxID=1897614 RepID=UPI0025BED4F5|nr:PepSY-associated TM helix domain-containing protein [Maribacter sp.]
MRNIFRIIHLWVGLFTGLIIFVICITGSIYAFQKEIKLLIYPYYSVENSTLEKMPLADLLKLYESSSENKVLYVYDFTESRRTTILRTSKNGNLYDSFVDPYTGELLKEKEQSKDFFTVVLKIHRNLLLKKEIGRKIIGYSVILFIISLITGIILWFPKSKKIFKSKNGRKSKFTIKKTSNIKRILYDLHSVLGFYSSFILIIIAITGLGWTFSWVDESLYRMVTFEKKEKKNPIIIDNATLSYEALDVAKKKMDYNQKNRRLFLYILPKTTTLPLKVTAYPNDDSYRSSDHFYIHPATGNIINTELDINKKRGAKFRSLYYDIHTGSILSIWGKILVFFTGLIGASLPITGFVLWVNTR